MTIEEIAAKVRAGERVSADEALELYRRAPTALLGQLADGIRERKHPNGIVTYIIDRNVNYTNVCVAKCNFCAFYRPVGSPEGYVLGFDELFRKIDETIAVGASRYSASASADVTRPPARTLSAMMSMAINRIATSRGPARARARTHSGRTVPGLRAPRRPTRT